MDLRKRKVETNNLNSTKTNNTTTVKEPKQKKTRTTKKSEIAATKEISSESSNKPVANADEALGKVDDELFKVEEFLTDPEWKALLKDEFEKDYFKEINKQLSQAYKKNLARPAKNQIFHAFNLTPLKNIKCVILGQDPYHDDGQAHGLAFSVPENIPPPPSLKNIFKELAIDIPGFNRGDPNSSSLEKWAQRGVFLLNTVLTVEAHQPGSHGKIGWNQFTDRVISLVSELNDGCVFVLWGNLAHKKESLISSAAGKNHKIIKAAHPSPLSLNKFLNSKCFSQTNQHLKSIGKTEIDWSLN